MTPTLHQPIVCGTDFSEPAQRAADIAALFARQTGAGLLLVHGIDERAEFPPNVWPRLIAEDTPRLAAEGERLRAAGFALDERIVGAAPDDGVVRCAAKAGAGMIVVASSGLGAVGRWIMGSVSERIAETAAVPTLVVREPAALESWLRGERPLRVFIAADSAPGSALVLQWAQELTRIAPCDITVGHVDLGDDERAAQAIHRPEGAPPPPEMHQMLSHDLREQARALFGELTFQVHVLAASDRTDIRLLELAREAGAELIVVGSHQWHGLQRLRHPSVSRHVLHDAKVNVACVPMRATVAK